jgi:hypothetical protein
MYLVVLPNGSILDINALGAHSTFQYDGQNVIWAWMYAAGSLSDAMQVATHEIVEAVGADGGSAPKELCDDCHAANPYGKLVNGIRVETYFDRTSGTLRLVATGLCWIATRTRPRL